ncbi:SDR family oxidoreductase [Hyphomonas sp.]|uniref:SDR family oxidoreductase n=1 Tax=Hyphomonas sp. TaxID=87 RepID=UPI003526D823
MSRKSAFDLNDRTVLITGGARGIGRALSEALLAHGCTIIPVGRDRAALDAFARQHPGRVHPWCADLSNPRNVDALVRDLPGAHPDLSLVVNNAGLQTAANYIQDDVEALAPAARREIAVNFDAVVRLSTGLLPFLLTRRSAGIVNISSSLAVAPKKSAPVYCATKAGVRNFTRALSYQCEDQAPHVRIFDVVMGLVDTDMTAGRASGKIPPAQAAHEILEGVRRGHGTIPVAQAKALLAIARIAPGLAARVLRNS